MNWFHFGWWVAKNAIIVPFMSCKLTIQEVAWSLSNSYATKEIFVKSKIDSRLV
jgi:hypothetical protein